MARCLSEVPFCKQPCRSEQQLSENAGFLSSRAVRAWLPQKLNLRIKRANEACFLDSCFINCCLSQRYSLEEIHSSGTRLLRLQGGFKLHILGLQRL